jgi:hypothetical protein
MDSSSQELSRLRIDPVAATAMKARRALPRILTAVGGFVEIGELTFALPTLAASSISLFSGWWRSATVGIIATGKWPVASPQFASNRSFTSFGSVLV